MYIMYILYIMHAHFSFNVTSQSTKRVQFAYLCPEIKAMTASSIFLTRSYESVLGYDIQQYVCHKGKNDMSQNSEPMKG